MGSRRRSSSPLLVAAVFVLASCSGDDPSGRVVAPSAAEAGAAAAALSGDEPQPTPASTPAPAWIPPGTYACALGKGDRDASCAPGQPPAFAAEVDAAIDEVLRDRGALFFEGGDLTARVRDEEPFHLAVADVLRARGYCAGWDVIDLQVRNATNFSEQYDLFDRRGRLHEPALRYRSTCAPARFPLDAGEHIDSLRVALYGVTCPDGRTPPRNAEARIPLGCTGYVTATPKDRNGDDVDRRLHGPYITWQLDQRYEFVRAVEYPGVDFNKVLRTESRGDFRLCATVQGHTGCLEGRVTAQ